MRTNNVHLSEPTPPLPTTPLSIAIATHFGVLDATVPATRTRRLTRSGEPLRTKNVDPHRVPLPPAPSIALPLPGRLMLISGASGSGKSSLLRSLLRPLAGPTQAVDLIDLNRIALPERPIVDLFSSDDRSEPKDRFAPILRRLARVGLAEVWTWLRPPSQLSEGQRWRLRLALAMHTIDQRSPLSPTTLIVCDEFAALLDRITAHIVAGALRRFVDDRRDRTAAIVATSHDDLRRALEPDVIAACDFGEIAVRRVRRLKHLQPSTRTNASH